MKCNVTRMLDGHTHTHTHASPRIATLTLHSGVGLGLAERFVDHYRDFHRALPRMNLVLAGRSPARIETAQKALKERAGSANVRLEVTPLLLDLCDAESVERACAELQRR